MAIEIQSLSLVENAKINPLHFPLQLEGLRDQGSLNGAINLYGILYGLPTILHGMQRIMFHALLDFASSPTQRFGSNTKSGGPDTSKSHNP